MCQPSGVDTQTVSFWTDNLAKVLIWSFSKTKVSSMMRIETHKLKNKVSKTQKLEMYLTFIFIVKFNCMPFATNVSPKTSLSISTSLCNAKSANTNNSLEKQHKTKIHQIRKG
jgi:hypothetical protein